MQRPLRYSKWGSLRKTDFQKFTTFFVRKVFIQRSAVATGSRDNFWSPQGWQFLLGFASPIPDDLLHSIHSLRFGDFDAWHFGLWHYVLGGLFFPEHLWKVWCTHELQHQMYVKNTSIVYCQENSCNNVSRTLRKNLHGVPPEYRCIKVYM